MKSLRIIALVAAAILGFAGAARAQVQTSTSTFDITSNGGFNVNLAQFTGTLANLHSIVLQLNVTSIDFTANIGGNGGTPTATFQDAVAVQNGIPAALDFDTSFTAPGTLGQNSNQGYVINSAAVTNPAIFTGLPGTDNAPITMNFANYVGSGTWSDSIMSTISTLTSSNGNVQSFNPISVQGTLEVFYNEAAPEPNSGELGLVAGLALAALAGVRRISRA